MLFRLSSASIGPQKVKSHRSYSPLHSLFNLRSRVPIACRIRRDLNFRTDLKSKARLPVGRDSLAHLPHDDLIGILVLYLIHVELLLVNRSPCIPDVGQNEWNEQAHYRHDLKREKT